MVGITKEMVGMRKLALILTLIFFSVMFSSTSFAGWTKVTTDSVGTNLYVDFERIRKHDGYVYYWTLDDNPHDHPSGLRSIKSHNQGDCKKFRVKPLSITFHKEPMRAGDSAFQKKTQERLGRFLSESSIFVLTTHSEQLMRQFCTRGVLMHNGKIELVADLDGVYAKYSELLV